VTAIRPYRPDDRDDVYRICVLTGESGGDATGLYPPRLIPDVYAGPYLELEPDLAFVVDTGSGVAGYVIGTSDTRAFVERYRDEWLPGFTARYPRPEPGTVPRHVSEMIDAGLRPERMLIPEVDEYPAHLHIDILPELQGAGWGRALIGTLLDTLAGRGIQRLHLSMSPANTGARAFYDRLGFTELPSSTPTGPVLGISTRAHRPA
jgi:ribosomal protein S18 acetylase RimI-like enzyme